MKFVVLDERNAWWRAAIDAARNHGFSGKRIWRGSECGQSGIGFIRPHADWRVLPRNRKDFAVMSERLTMIQDAAQVEVYEDKSEQFRRWSRWMPETWRFTDANDAMEFAKVCDLPIVSKADVGSSSHNVRIIGDRDELMRHVIRVFGGGVQVRHGGGCPDTAQRGYVLLQRCIPHTVTYRVNAIGDCRAVFFRRCYPDRMVAQTGNVEPAFEMTDEVESLLAYSDRVFADIGTQWCALDILRDGDRWKLLETSLAWPWPSPGRCNEGTIFRSKSRKWIEMFDVLFDEIERGAWAGV